MKTSKCKRGLHTITRHEPESPAAPVEPTEAVKQFLAQAEAHGMKMTRIQEGLVKESIKVDAQTPEQVQRLAPEADAVFVQGYLKRFELLCASAEEDYPENVEQARREMFAIRRLLHPTANHLERRFSLAATCVDLGVRMAEIAKSVAHLREVMDAQRYHAGQRKGAKAPKRRKPFMDLAGSALRDLGARATPRAVADWLERNDLIDRDGRVLPPRAARGRYKPLALRTFTETYVPAARIARSALRSSPSTGDSVGKTPKF